MEVYYNGEWSTVCANGWDLIDAQVVCRQLGYGQAINAKSGAFYGLGGSRNTFYNVNCVGTEFTIGDCSHNGWGYHDCFHFEDAGLKCSALKGKFILMYSLNLPLLYLFIDESVRLVYGSTVYKGRVEVYYNGEWGTVCANGWDLNDAQVVCRQLGYGKAISARNNAFYGQGNGSGTARVWLDDVNCDGNELVIGDCSHSGWGFESCSHYEDAGVECSPNGEYGHN